MKDRTRELEMSSEENNSSMPSSCSNLRNTGSSLEAGVSPKSTSSLSEAFDDLKLGTLEQVPSPTESDNMQVEIGIIS